MSPVNLQEGCENSFTGWTNPYENPRAIILCIDALYTSPTPDEEWIEEDTILGTFVPDLEPNPSNGVFSYFKPKSTTFLHEVFHLYYGNEDTPDSTCKSVKGQAYIISF